MVVIHHEWSTALCYDNLARGVTSLLTRAHPLLLLVLLEHALIDLVSFEDLRLAPLLQLTLHVFAQAHVEDLVE